MEWALGLLNSSDPVHRLLLALHRKLACLDQQQGYATTHAHLNFQKVTQEMTCDICPSIPFLMVRWIGSAGRPPSQDHFHTRQTGHPVFVHSTPMA